MAERLYANASMSRIVPISLAGLLLVVLAGAYWAQQHLAVPSSVPPRPVSEKHYVTPKQLVESGEMTARAVGSLEAVKQNGRPLLVVFVKSGCSCNAELEPLFRRLWGAYGEVVAFANVIDGDGTAAQEYARTNRVPYPVVADPKREIIARFGARNGVYVALVTPSGVLDVLWPGCSATMLRELGSRMAELAGVEEQPLSTDDAPTVLTTGCPFTD